MSKSEASNASQHLLLVDTKSASRIVFPAYLSAIKTLNPSLILLEKSKEADAWAALSAPVKTLPEIRHVFGEEIAPLWKEARSAVDVYLSLAQDHEYIRAFNQPYPLWDALQERVATVFYEILRDLHALHRLLSSTAWGEVTFMGPVKPWGLAHIFIACHKAWGFRGKVTVLTCEKKSSEEALIYKPFNPEEKTWKRYLTLDTIGLGGDESTLTDALGAWGDEDEELLWKRLSMPVTRANLTPHSFGSVLLRSLRATFKKRPSHDLFFIVGKNRIFANTAVPLIKSLSASRDIGLMLPDAYHDLEAVAKDVDLVQILDWIPLSGWFKYRIFCKRVRRMCVRIQEGSHALMQHPYLGVPMGALCVRGLVRSLSNELPLLYLYALGLASYLKESDPEAIVALPNRDARSIIAIFLGRGRSIPAVGVQQALVLSALRELNVYADQMAVMDDYAKQLYLNAGVPEEKLIVCGMPAWDNIADYRRRYEATLSVYPDHPTLLYATQHSTPQHIIESILSTIKRVMQQHAAMKLIIKVHPSEKKDLYEKILAEDFNNDARVSIVHQGPLYETLVESNIIVTLTSNVALEAALLGKDVIIADFVDSASVYPFVESGSALGVDTVEALEERLLHLLRDPTYRETVRERREQFYNKNPQLLDGKSVERVCELVTDAISAKGEV